MAKSKYTESHNVKVEGIVDIENMTIEVEEVGTKELADILQKFNGCNIKLSIALINELD